MKTGTDWKHTGLTKHLLALATALLGHMRGGLALPIDITQWYDPASR